MVSSNKLKILIVDNHDIARKGLAMLVSRHNDLAVVAEAGTMVEAIKKARESVPDVVVMDIVLPDGSGIEACRDIRAENPSVKVLMLTSYGNPKAVVSSILAGASGYLLKKTHSQDISDAIRKADAGDQLLDQSVIANALEHMQNNEDNPILAQFTDQEQKIFKLIIDGKTNRQISDIISLSNGAVKDYVNDILRKLEISRR